MRISNLFRRSRIQGSMIARKDGEGPNLMAWAEERSLGRRQSNLSEPSSSTTETESSAEPVSIAQPSSQGTDIPSSNPIPTTLATSVINIDPATSVLSSAVVSTHGLSVQPPPSAEAAPSPSTTAVPSSAATNTVPVSDPVATAEPATLASSILEASSVASPESTSASAAAVSSVASDPVSIATTATVPSDVAPGATSAPLASSVDPIQPSVTSSIIGASSATSSLAPGVASTQVSGTSSGSSGSISQTGGFVTSSAGSTTGGVLVGSTGTSSGPASITNGPASGSGSSKSLADILASSALSQALIPVSALTNNPTLTSGGSSSNTASLFAQAQSATAGTGENGGEVLSSGVGGNRPFSTGTGGVGTLSATAEFVKKPENVAGIVIGSVVGVLALGFGIFFFMRRFFRNRRMGIGRKADTPPQTPLLPPALNSPLPIGIARSMSQRSGGGGSFWSGQGTGGMNEKEYRSVRGVSPAPLSPLPGMPRFIQSINGMSERREDGNGRFSLFPPPVGGRKGNQNFPRDF